MRRKLSVVLVGLALALLSGLSVSSVRVALADPPEGTAASCMGYEASSVSPVGAEDGVYSQYGMPGVLSFIDQVVIPLTGADNRGQVISSGPAHLRGPGSHEECDEALGIPPGAE